MEVAACEHLAGSCGYHQAKWVRNSGVMVINNDSPHEEYDGMCFYLAVAAHFCKQGASINTLCLYAMDNINPLEQGYAVPVKVSDIEKFEALNEDLDFAVNVVYQDEEGHKTPVYASKNVTATNCILLLLFYDVAAGDEHVEQDGSVRGRLHYAHVPDPQTLFARRVVEASGNKTYRQHLCFSCFNRFERKDTYLRHVQFCHQSGCQRVIVPHPGETLSFESQSKSVSKQFESAYILFFDFEALQLAVDQECSCPEEWRDRRRREEAMSEEEKYERALEEMMMRGEETARYETRQQQAKKLRLGTAYKPPLKRCHHKTFAIRNQNPFFYAFMLVNRDGEVCEVGHYFGEDAADHFVEKLFEIKEKYLPSLSPGEPMKKLSREDKAKLAAADYCYLCLKPLLHDDRVLDHDHLNGNFLGVAHNACNLNRRELQRLTCFAHNFGGYDSHFLIRALVKKSSDIFAIPVNQQKFKSITCDGRIHFVDSLQFLPRSLSELTEVLKQSHSDFPYLSKVLPPRADKELFLRKGVYPYIFATSIRRLRKAKQLPSKVHFYNDLAEEPCSDEDYEYAEEVFKKLKCKNMLDYTRIYGLVDVALLADVVMNFRSLIYSKFGLDACQYLSLPHLALDVMLKESKVEIELLTDMEMNNMLQSNIRGGMSFVNLRHARRLQRSKGDWTDQVLVYLDANNLYGAAMLAKLPLNGFEWMDEQELDRVRHGQIPPDDADSSFIVEVDLVYPADCHLLHNSFPLAPEHVEITDEDLSPYSADCRRRLYGKEKYKAKKLTATFRDRKKYVVHAANLKFYLEKGMVLTKVHRGIKFNCDNYLHDYIMLCTKNRTGAATKVEQEMWKFIVNSGYGKFIEALERRLHCRFNKSEESAVRSASSPLFKGMMALSEDLSVTFMNKGEVKMKQSWAVGFSILERSKLIMYHLYYNILQPILGLGNVSVIMSDTDSFLLAVNAASEEEVMGKLQGVMDFSNFDPERKLHNFNEKMPGFLKNEMPNARIIEAVALRSKVYCFQTESLTGEEGKFHGKLKGVTRSVTRALDIGRFRNCVENVASIEVKQRQLRSRNHQNQVIEARKTAVTSFDDKRYQLCPRHSVPYGSLLARGVPGLIEAGHCFFCHNPHLLY